MQKYRTVFCDILCSSCNKISRLATQLSFVHNRAEASGFLSPLKSICEVNVWYRTHPGAVHVYVLSEHRHGKTFLLKQRRHEEHLVHSGTEAAYMWM